jgi:hypothetical protein
MSDHARRAELRLWKQRAAEVLEEPGGTLADLPFAMITDMHDGLRREIGSIRALSERDDGQREMIERFESLKKGGSGQSGWVARYSTPGPVPTRAPDARVGPMESGGRDVWFHFWRGPGEGFTSVAGTTLGGRFITAGAAKVVPGSAPLDESFRDWLTWSRERWDHDLEEMGPEVDGWGDIDPERWGIGA